jgi:trehalose 6-phosphate synthase
LLPDAAVDRASSAVMYAGRETSIHAYPISIEWPSRVALQSSPIDVCRASVRQRLNVSGDARIIVGIDRLDYTKGICEKALAVERLLECNPDLLGKVIFVQVAEPSRAALPAYRELRSRLVATVARVNRRFATSEYQPIILLETHHDPSEVYELLRSADVCYVGSLHDGMNLVAKEFVAARDDCQGVLVLSALTGAAHQLSGALLVNPYVTDESARVLARALRMAPDEQSARMQLMRAIVAEFNSYRWIGEMLEDAWSLRQGRGRVEATTPHEREDIHETSGRLAVGMIAH